MDTQGLQSSSFLVMTNFSLGIIIYCAKKELPLSPWVAFEKGLRSSRGTQSVELRVRSFSVVYKVNCMSKKPSERLT